MGTYFAAYIRKFRDEYFRTKCSAFEAIEHSQMCRIFVALFPRNVRAFAFQGRRYRWEMKDTEETN